MSAYFSDNTIEAGHGRRSLRGGAVVIGARALIAIVQVGTIIVLARLLSPEDYGLVSMVTVITGFAPLLVSLGTPDAVVQRTRVSENEVSALFWLSVAVGTALAIALGLCGPLVARFYGEPRLTMIAVVSATTFIAAALTCQHYALMRRAMKFRELAILDVGANLLSSGVAIAMAVSGFEYWALVMRPVMMTALLAAGVWLRCKWIPPKPVLTSGAKDMLRLGLHSTGFSLTDFIGGSADKVAIGYRSGTAPLGYYQNALFVYGNLLDLLVSPLHGVAVASLSKAREDLPELRRLWGKALLTLAFYSMPAFGILAVVGQDLIVILLGAKWAPAGFLLSILALRGIPHSMERTLGWLHVTSGRTDRWMRWGVLATGVQLVALFCGLPFGPTGVAVAYVICTFVLFVPAIAYSGAPVGVGARDVILVVWRPLVGSLFAAAIGFGVGHAALADTSGIGRIGVLSVVYTTVYLAIVVGLFGIRMPLVVVTRLVQDMLATRFSRGAKKSRNAKTQD